MKIVKRLLIILLISISLIINVKADKKNFEQIDIELLNEIIEMENSLIVFVGNSNDSDYKVYLDTYYDIYDMQDEEVKSHFVMLNNDYLEQTNIKRLLSYAYKEEDKNTVSKAIDDMLNDKTGNSCVIYIYNKTITNAIKNSLDLYEDYDVSYVVNHDFYSNYRHSNINNNSYALKANENDYWVYNAKAKLQEFVAPVSGTYHIKLWGATGDSDLGLKVQSGPNVGNWSHGYGGGSGFSYADIELLEGQTIYLALGFRNNFSLSRSYNGGGAGAPGYLGYRAGGGGAGSIYLSEKGNGNLSDYEQFKQDIIMVAGGGGGAEDYYHATWAYNPYPCSYEYCMASSGGNGGINPTGGISQGATALTTGYMFGQGQDYNSYENASSGAGGGGYLGGLSADGNTIVLKGGTGAGGLSYINEDLTSNGRMENGQNVTITCVGNNCFEDTTNDINALDENSTYAHDAGAIITLKEIKKHLLTINYLDVYNNQKLHDSYQETISYGQNYQVISPDIEGYTVYDPSDEIVEGIMIDEDVTIDVYYGYPGLFIYYQDYDTKETLAATYSDHLKIDSYYTIDSYDIDGYVRVDDDHDVISGYKKDELEEYYVYYVSQVKPVKAIFSVNGKEVKDNVQLKKGDIVTYLIEIENKRLVDENIIFEEHLPDTVKYLNSNDILPVSINNRVLTYNINVKARTKLSIYLECEVINEDNNIKDIHNEIWQNNQKVFETNDPFVSYEIIKSSDIKELSKVGYEQEITYNLTVINNGQNEVNNIVVVDKIPDNTAYSYIDRQYNGSYHKDDNYVSFVVDSLLPDAKIRLSYKVKVTKKIEDNSEERIVNAAYYDNFDKTINDNSQFEEVLNKGKQTNEVIHYITGPKLTISKTSTPFSESIVKKDDIIDYHVTISNEGSVSANHLRIYDAIPQGTTYVEDSLSLEADDTSLQEYTFSHGDSFDIYYDMVNKQYYLDNIATIQTTTNDPIKALQLYYPEGLSITNETIPANWTKYNVAGNTVYFNIEKNNSQTTIQNYLKSLRFNGIYGIKGEIRIDVFDAAMIARFDNEGIIHFYKFVDSNNITFTNAKAKAATQFFGGLQGYLATITSKDEQDFLANSVATKSGWLGGSRIKAYGSISGNWEWINGPEKGQQFYTAATAANRGHALNGMYNNFNSGEPNATDHGDTYLEGCLQAFHLNGKWNDLTNDKHGAELLGYYLEFSDGYNGYYLTRSKYTTSLPTPSNNSGCKYIDNGQRAYVECISSNLAENNSVTMHFSVKADNVENVDHIDNIAYFDNYYDNIGNAGALNDIPSQRSNMTIHYLYDKQLNVEILKSSEPVNGSMVNINDEINYKLIINNTGDIDIKYLKVKDPIPKNTIYKLHSINQNGYYDDNSVNWIIEDLAANESIELYFSVIVTKQDDTNQIINKAMYDIFYEYPNEDEPLNNVTNTIQHFIYDVTDNNQLIIEVNKNSLPANNSNINRNSEIEYQIEIKNNSEVANANYIIVKDEIPAGTSFMEVLNDDVEYLFKDNTIYYLIEVIKPQESIILKFKVLVDKETTLKQIDNKASYDILETKVDLKQFEHDSYKTTNVVTHYLKDPLISLIKESDPISNSLIGKQRNITYSLILTNISDTLANYVYIKDPIDENLELNINSISSNDPQDEIEVIDNIIKWKVYDLDQNDTHVLSYQANVKKNVRSGAEISNIAYYAYSIKDKEIDIDIASNIVKHYVEIGVDIIQTGGKGYNNQSFYLMMMICILLMIYQNKQS